MIVTCICNNYERDFFFLFSRLFMACIIHFVSSAGIFKIFFQTY